MNNTQKIPNQNFNQMPNQAQGFVPNQIPNGYYVAPNGQILPYQNMQGQNIQNPNMQNQNMQGQNIQNPNMQNLNMQAGMMNGQQRNPGYVPNQNYNGQGMNGSFQQGMNNNYQQQGMYTGAPIYNGNQGYYGTSQMPSQGYNQQGMGYQQMPQYQNVYRQPKPKKKSFESAIGKNLMGILASLLIFAGLILTVRATYEYMDEIGRMIGMYSVSFILFGIGLAGKRFYKNPFFLSLTGCGVGAIYISLFLTYSYFGAINMLVLYLLLTVWSVIVYFLGGRGSQVFKVIGQLGILVSLIYGNVCVYKDDLVDDVAVSVFTLLVFYIGVSIFYLLMSREKGVAKNLPSLIINLLGTIALEVAVYALTNQHDFAYQGHIEDSVVETFIVLMAGILVQGYMLFLLHLFIVRVDKVCKNGASVGWCFYAGVAMLIASSSFGLSVSTNEWIGGVIGLLFYIGVSVLNELRKNTGASNKFMIIFLSPFLMIACMNLDVASKIIGIGILVLPYVLFSYFKRSRLYLALAMVSSWIFLLTDNEYPAAYAVFAVVFMLFLLGVQILCKEVYAVGFKMAFYIIAQTFILRVAAMMVDNTDIMVSAVTIYSYAFVASVLLCALATFTRFSQKWDETRKIETAMRLFLGVVNAIIMLLGSILIFGHFSEGIHAMDVTFLFIATIMNIFPLVKYYPKSGATGFYIGLKLTVFLICSLYSYDAEGYIVSLCCLIMAIACIVFGFVAKYKYIRFYGLLLAIISILKMVFFDLKFDSTLARAISITVCGLIAFAISFVYSMFDRKSDDKIQMEDFASDFFGIKKQPAKSMAGPGMNMQMQQGMNMQMQPGMNMQMQPGMNMQMQPGMNMQMQPGMNMQMQPGMNMQMGPGMNMQMQPGMNMQMGPGMNMQMQPGMNAQKQSEMNMPIGLNSGAEKEETEDAEKENIQINNKDVAEKIVSDSVEKAEEITSDVVAEKEMEIKTEESESAEEAIVESFAEDKQEATNNTKKEE